MGELLRRITIVSASSSGPVLSWYLLIAWLEKPPQIDTLH